MHEIPKEWLGHPALKNKKLLEAMHQFKLDEVPYQNNLKRYFIPFLFSYYLTTKSVTIVLNIWALKIAK